MKTEHLPITLCVKYILFISALLNGYSIDANAQNSWFCGVDDTPPYMGNSEKSASFCSDVNRYIPGYITDASISNMLTINVTAFVMCHNGDTMLEPFAGYPLNEAYLNHWINMIYNPELSTNIAPSMTNPAPTLEQSEWGIRLKLKEVVYVESPDPVLTGITPALVFVEQKIDEIWPDGKGNSIVFFIGRWNHPAGGGAWNMASCCPLFTIM